jgi:NitT/TauT family transport system substrate-binding protein
VNRRLSRGMALRSLAVVSAAAAVPSRVARAQTPAKITVVAVPIDISAAPYYAEDEGFFKRAGLDADVLTMGGGPAIIAAMLNGSLDFGSAGITSIAIAHENGIPILMVAPAGSYTSKSPTGGLLVTRNSPLRTAKDLIGKTVGVGSLKVGATVALQAWLDKNGVAPDAVKLVEVPFASIGAALEARRIDGAVTEEPYFGDALEHGARLFAHVYDGIAPEWLEGAYVCTAAFAKAHPDVVLRFRDAIAATNTWADANHAASAGILEKYTKQAVPPTMTRATFVPRLRVEDVQPVIDISAKYGLIKSSFPASDVIAPGVLG